MQWPHPSFGDAFLFLVLVWLMRWHVAVVQSWSQRSQRAWSKLPPAAYFITHSSTRARLSSSLFRTCLFLRTPIHKCGRLPHRSTQASLAAVLRVRRAAFFLSSLFGSYFLFMVAGEVPAVPEQQLRLPHRSRRQNEVPVVRWRGISTYPNRHGTCFSVSPYGRHTHCGSLWCPFPAVVRPSWSTEF